MTKRAVLVHLALASLIEACSAQSTSKDQAAADSAGGAGKAGGADESARMPGSGGVLASTLGTGGVLSVAPTQPGFGGTPVTMSAPALDGGIDWATGRDFAQRGGDVPGGDAPQADVPAGWVRAIMYVGYGGIRVVSSDQGKTWKKVAELSVGGGDDRQLLRAVAYGNGTWVVSGWRWFTSPDAQTWTESPAVKGCNIMEGLAFGNGTFVGACGDDAYTSTDAVTWTRAGKIGGTGGHTYLLFAAGRFAASGDSGASFVSTDGKNWQSLAGVTKVTFCEGEYRSGSGCLSRFWQDGVWLRDAWRGKIERSQDGKAWRTVYTDGSMNGGYRFGTGFMPPAN